MSLRRVFYSCISHSEPGATSTSVRVFLMRQSKTHVPINNKTVPVVHSEVMLSLAIMIGKRWFDNRLIDSRRLRRKGRVQSE
jgi:hypothetical protein